MPNKNILNEVRSIRNNNPGNLRAVDAKTQQYLTQPGYVLDNAIGFDEHGFAIFPDQEAGMDAMQRQIRIDAGKGMTGAQMINKYAPKDDNTPLGKKYPNDPNAYIDDVFTKSGLDPNKQIDSKDIDTIQRAMVKKEGGQGAYDHFYGGSNGPLFAARARAGANDPIDLYKKIMGFKDINEQNQSKKSPTKITSTLAENSIRFKDLRHKIHEQIIRNEQQNVPSREFEFVDDKGNFMFKDENGKIRLKPKAEYDDKGSLRYPDWYQNRYLNLETQDPTEQKVIDDMNKKYEEELKLELERGRERAQRDREDRKKNPHKYPHQKNGKKRGPIFQA